MKASHRRKPLTFGNLIEAIYGVYGKRRAGGFIRFALDARIVVFREQRRVLDLLNRGMTP